MEYCTLCVIEKRGVNQSEPTDTKENKNIRCSNCFVKFRDNLRATFNMYFVDPDGGIDIDFNPNMGPICDTCNAGQTSRPGFKRWEHFENIKVNRKISCERCFDLLSYKTTRNATFSSLSQNVDFDSSTTLSIGEEDVSFFEKMIKYCCCFRCG